MTLSSMQGSYASKTYLLGNIFWCFILIGKTFSIFWRAACGMEGRTDWNARSTIILTLTMSFVQWLICIMSVFLGFGTNVSFPGVLLSSPHKGDWKQDAIAVIWYFNTPKNIQDGDSDFTIVTSSGHVTIQGVLNTRWQWHTY